jgi:hypothetical protein
MTLWSIFRNPLIYGGDVRALAGDSWTVCAIASYPRAQACINLDRLQMSLLTNAEVLALQVWNAEQYRSGLRAHNDGSPHCAGHLHV